MNDYNQLHHNDGEWRHQIIIFIKVVNDAAPEAAKKSFVKMWCLMITAGLDANVQDP